MRISKLFLNDNFILALILLNAVVLFVGGYFPSDMGRLILSIADNTITVLFVVELVVKFNKFGARGYLSSGWNRFDFILILLSLPALITFIFNINSGDISFLLVFRVMRVFKSFRFFKLIPNFNQIVSGLQRALKTSVFVLLGFLIYIFIIGVLSFYLFKDSGTDYFRDPVISLYSTFKIFTVEGWFEIPERLTEHYSRIQSFFTYFYFLLF
jgi:voltage-gated sodium channel